VTEAEAPRSPILNYASPIVVGAQTPGVPIVGVVPDAAMTRGILVREVPKNTASNEPVVREVAGYEPGADEFGFVLPNPSECQFAAVGQNGKQGPWSDAIEVEADTEGPAVPEATVEADGNTVTITLRDVPEDARVAVVYDSRGNVVDSFELTGGEDEVVLELTDPATAGGRFEVAYRDEHGNEGEGKGLEVVLPVELGPIMIDAERHEGYILPNRSYPLHVNVKNADGNDFVITVETDRQDRSLGTVEPATGVVQNGEVDVVFTVGPIGGVTGSIKIDIFKNGIATGEREVRLETAYPVPNQD